MRRLIDRFRQRGVAGTARFAARTGAVALRSPREALDHLETQLALTRSAPPPSPVATDPEWERRLHEALGASWPCKELAAFGPTARW